MHRSWPLIGRDAELRQAAAAVDDPEARGVAFVGDQGVGKSRLVSETMALARTRGLVTREVLASAAAAQMPFGPLANLLPLPSTTAAAGLDALNEARRVLAEELEGERVALGVDDGHLLDAASSALLYQLAATGAAFLVISAPSTAGLPEDMVRLFKEGMVRRVGVKPLDVASIEDIVTAALRGHVDGGTRRDLAAAVRGNLLFLRELIEFGHASGALDAGDGVWRWRGPIVPGGGLRELIEDRLRRLQPEERHLLEVLAAGEPLNTAMLERLAPAGALAALDRQGLLSLIREGNRTSVRIEHPLHAEVVRQATAPMQLREIYRQLAAVLVEMGGRRHDDRLRLTIWTLAQGRLPPAADLILAARQALAAGDHRLSEHLAEAAVRAGGGFAAGLVLGESLATTGRYDEAEGVLVGLVEAAATDEERVQLAVVRAANLFAGRTRAMDAELVLEQAQATIADRSLRDELSTQRALLLIAHGRTAQALHGCSAVIDRPGARPTAVIRALAVAGFAHALMAHPERALAHVERGERMLKSERDQPHRARLERHLVDTRWEALWFAGRLDEAEQHASAAYHRALEERAETRRAMAAFRLGLCIRERGRLSSAIFWLTEAVALLRIFRPVMLPAALAALAQAHAVAGDAAVGQAVLREAESLGARPFPPDEVRTRISRAWVMAAGGEVARAQSMALHAADMAGRAGLTALEAIALHTVARLGDARAVAGRLVAAADGAEGELLPTLAHHAEAVAAGGAAALDDVASAFEDMGMLLCAAEAASEAALAHQRLGHRRQVRDSYARARALLQRCGRARTPACARVDTPHVMTRRQRQIAALAAAGLRSRDIAHRLSLSARTVDNHLQRIYVRLDIRSRAELPSALVGDSDVDEVDASPRR